MLRLRLCRIISLIALSLSLLACNDPAQRRTLTLATTTSTENSGLLEYLLPEFEKTAPVTVHVIAVGTGKALRMAQDGDVDMVLVHAKSAELAFVEAGYGVERARIMLNDFVLVGPENDPAGLATVKRIDLVMLALAQKPVTFVSRGDDSGTHKKEQQLWQQSQAQPAASAYIETGQGMGKTLQIANELRAYTLVDRGTWLSYKDQLALKILFEGAPQLANQYAAILVNPERYPDRNSTDAKTFISWLVSDSGQRQIGDFTVNGEQLFKPNAQ